jgi:acyl dehydratase
VSGGALATARCYFEDVETAVALETPAITLTRAHVALFAGVTADPTLREADAIPDLLPLCLSSGLGWRVPRPPLAVLAFMGFEWRFLSPVSVGDTIHSVSRTLAKRSMREGGVVIEERLIINQRGETVQSGKLTLLVERRPA